MNVNAPELSLSLTGRLSLLERAQAGDLESFEALLRSHQRQVLGTALRMLGGIEDAQDAAQEVFLKLFRNLKRFESEEAIAPWLYRVTLNVCNDAWRKRRPASDLADFDFASAAPDPEVMAGQSERQRVVARGLATLAQKERAALVLREVEGLSTREVAEILGSTEGTVRTQVCIARMKLKKFTDRYLRKKS